MSRTKYAPPPIQPRQPARRPPKPPPPAAPAERDPSCFRLASSCPECGAPVSFGEEDRSATCDYCGSLLVLELDDHEPCFYLPTRLHDEKRLVAALALYRAMALRPAIASRYADAHAEFAILPEGLIDGEVRRLERRYLSDIRIESVTTVHVPYRLCLGELGQAFVGRQEYGAKDVSFRVYALEYTLRGYDEARANMRDKGLKLPLGRLCILTSEIAAAMPGRFLVADTDARTPVERASRLLPRAQDKTLTPIVPPRGELLFIHQCLVYKPFLFVDYSLEGGQSLVLIDGATEQIAGQPGSGEAAALDTSERFAAEGTFADSLVHRFASECPVCGNELELDRRARFQLCSTCNRALSISGDGIDDSSYLFEAADAAAGAVAWLPWWRFRFRLVTSAGADVGSLAELYGCIAGGFGPPPRSGEHLAIPAIRCLGHKTLDRAFAALAWRGTHDPPDRLHDGPMNPDTPGRRLCVTLDAEEARQIAPLVLYTLLDKPRRARINMPKVRDLLASSSLELSEPTLVLRPLPLTGGRVQLGGDEAIGIGVLESDASDLSLRERLRWSV